MTPVELDGSQIPVGENKEQLADSIGIFSWSVNGENHAGTVFHIGDGIVVSAAHVVDTENCRTGEILWGFRGESGLMQGKCEYIIDRKSGPGQDFTIFKVQVPPPYKIDCVQREAQIDEQVVALGHPSSYPLMVSSGAVERIGGGIFTYSASTYPGHSGGPILDKDGKAIGLISKVDEKTSFGLSFKYTPISQYCQ